MSIFIRCLVKSKNYFDFLELSTFEIEKNVSSLLYEYSMNEFSEVASYLIVN